MIFLRNYLLILIIRISNKFGRSFNLKKYAFSSQHILERNFPRNKLFNFVQVGANDGVSFDFLYDFVTKRSSQGVVIEPIKDYFNELEQNYKDFETIIKVNKAVHPTEKSVYINKISPAAINKYPDWVKGIASLDSHHHLKTGIDSNDIIKELVEADSLMNILKANLTCLEINYFQVDTEGFDFEVLKQLDFNFIKPSIIKYEKVNLSENDKIQLKSLLNSHNYFLFDELGDTIAINLNSVKLYK